MSKSNLSTSGSNLLSRKGKYNNNGNVVTPLKQGIRQRLSSSTGRKKEFDSVISVPSCIAAIVDEKSFKKNLLLTDCGEVLTLEEIKKPDKFDVLIQLFILETYPDDDLAVLRVRDGTICPSSMLCFPKASSWESVKHSITHEPLVRSNEPVVDILLYNSSFAILELKEWTYFTLRNVMVAKTVGNKGLLMCVNGKNAYPTKLSSIGPSNEITRKLAEKKYQVLEEKYLKILSNSVIRKSGLSNTIVSVEKKKSIREEDATDEKLSNDINVKVKSKRSLLENEDFLVNKNKKLKVGNVQSDTVKSKAIEVESKNSNKDNNKARKTSRSCEFVRDQSMFTPKINNVRISLTQLRRNDDDNFEKMTFHSVKKPEEEDDDSDGKDSNKCNTKLTKTNATINKTVTPKRKSLSVKQTIDECQSMTPLGIKMLKQDYVQSEQDIISEEESDVSKTKKNKTVTVISNLDRTLTRKVRSTMSDITDRKSLSKYANKLKNTKLTDNKNASKVNEIKKPYKNTQINKPVIITNEEGSSDWKLRRIEGDNATNQNSKIVDHLQDKKLRIESGNKGEKAVTGITKEERTSPRKLKNEDDNETKDHNFVRDKQVTRAKKTEGRSSFWKLQSDNVNIKKSTVQIQNLKLTRKSDPEEKDIDEEKHDRRSSPRALRSDEGNKETGKGAANDFGNLKKKLSISEVVNDDEEVAEAGENKKINEISKNNANSSNKERVSPKSKSSHKNCSKTEENRFEEQEKTILLGMAEESKSEENNLRQKLKNKNIPKYKTLSALNRDHLCVNTFGIIVNILENQDLNKLKVAVEIVDQTLEDPPFKAHLFLPQLALTALRKHIKKYQIIELIGLKVFKRNGVITGGVFDPISVELYDSVTGIDIKWHQSPQRLNKMSESSSKIIESLKSWWNLKISSDSGRGRLLLTRGSGSDSDRLIVSKEKPSQRRSRNDNKTTSSNVYDILEGIIFTDELDKARSEMVAYNVLDDFKEVTEEMKFNVCLQIVNVHRYDEINLDVIQARDGTRCPVPTLNIPLENNWSIAKQKILDDPLFTSYSPILNILCFESQPYLPPLEEGKFYRFNNLIAVKTQLSTSSYKKDTYLLYADSKDCDITEDKKSRKRNEFFRNKSKIIAEESSFLSSVFQQSKNTVYYPDSLRPTTISNDKLAEKVIPVKKVAVDGSSTKQFLLPSSEDSVDRAMCNLSLPGEKVEMMNQNDITKKKSSRIQNTDSTSFLIGLDTDIPCGVIREIDSMIQEESELGLCVTFSEDAHLKNFGTDPTYSEFAKLADDRSKMFKTSTQIFGIKEMAHMPSTVESNNFHCVENVSLGNVLVENHSDYSVDSVDSITFKRGENKLNNKKSSDNQAKIVNIEDHLHSCSLTDNKDKSTSNKTREHGSRSSNSISDNDDKVDSKDDHGSVSILNCHAVNKTTEIEKEVALSDSDLEIVESLERESREIVELMKKSWREEDSVFRCVNGVAKSGLTNLPTCSFNGKQPMFLKTSVEKNGFKIPSHYYSRSNSNLEEPSHDQDECEEHTIPTLGPGVRITTVTDFPDLPFISIREFLEMKASNCARYTVIPQKLFPELKDGWDEKAVHCKCSNCNKIFELSDLEKMSSETCDWPTSRIPVCPTDICNKKQLSVKNAFFHFKMELNLEKFKHICIAILESQSAETFLDCSVMEFLKNNERRCQVESRLNHLFQQSGIEKSNIYSFVLARKNIFDPNSSPFYIKDIRLK